MLCAVNKWPMIYAMNIKNKIVVLSMVGSIPMPEGLDSNQRGGDHDPSQALELEKQVQVLHG